MSAWRFFFSFILYLFLRILCAVNLLVIVCACACVCVWSHLARVFLEGNKSICYKKAACDLAPGPCCSLPLSARRARDIRRLRRGEREMNKGGGQKDGGTGEGGREKMPRQREIAG